MKFLHVICVIWWHSWYLSGKCLLNVVDATEPHDDTNWRYSILQVARAILFIYFVYVHVYIYICTYIYRITIYL